MRYIFTFLILIVLSINGQAQTSVDSLQKEDLSSSFERNVVDLSGQWSVSYDNKEWNEKFIPSVEKNTVVYYKRKININSSNAVRKSFFLEFQGVSDNLEIFINGQSIGNYFGGMTPFQVEIPDGSFRKGDNIIKLKVGPVEGLASQLEKYAFHSNRVYNGIIRGLNLVAVSRVRVKNITSTYKLTQNASKAAVNINSNISVTNLDEAENTVNIQVTVKDLSSKSIVYSGTKSQKVESSRNYDADFKAVINSPNLWSPETPNLYEIRTKIIRNGTVIDELTTKTGFKQVNTVVGNSKSSFLLNGKEFKLKSVNYINDFSGYGNSVPYQRYLEDVKDIKKLGANAVRVINGYPHPNFLEICQEEGLFIILELPVLFSPPSILTSNEVVVRMSNTLNRLLSYYEISPAVFSYGLCSYTGADSEVQDYISQLTKTLKNNSNNLSHKSILAGDEKIELDKFDFVIVKTNERTANLEPLQSKLNRITKVNSAIPIVFEMGLPIHKNNKNGYSDKLSLEFQAFYLLNLFKSLSKQSSGVVINSFNDYLLELPIMTTNAENKYVLTSGLMSRDRKERTAFKTVKAIFNNEKEPLLTAGSEPDNVDTVAFIVTGIVFTLIFLLMLNRFRRFREYFFRSLLRPYNFYADIRDQRLISTAQTVALSILTAVSSGAFVASLFHFLRYSSSLEYFLNIVLPLNVIKENLFSIIWNPAVLIIVLAIIFFVMIILAAIFLRIVAFVMSTRLFYRDAFTIVAWATIPSLILLPISIFMSRLLEGFSLNVAYAMAFWFLIQIWIFFRLLKSSYVVLDKPKGKVYLTELATALVLVGIPLLIFQLNRSVVDFLVYIFSVFV